VSDADFSGAERETFGVPNLRAGVEIGALTTTVFAESVLNGEYLYEVIIAIDFGGSFISPGVRRLVGMEMRCSF